MESTSRQTGTAAAGTSGGDQLLHLQAGGWVSCSTSPGGGCPSWPTGARLWVPSTTPTGGVELLPVFPEHSYLLRVTGT